MSGVASLIRAPSAGAAIATAGAVVSTTNVLAALVPVFPAVSACDACAVYVPSASAGEPSTVHVPPLRVAVSVWTGEPVAVAPAKTFRVTDAASPVALPAAPEYAGVVSLVREPSAGAVNVTAGGVVSTTNVLAVLVPLFPAVSVWVACTV